MKKLIFIILLYLCANAFGLTELDKENADRNLTSQVIVLTHTPSAIVPMQCQGLIYFGDGSKNLSGGSGTFSITVTIDGQTLQPDPQRIFFTTTSRSCVYTSIFPVPENNEVQLKVLSPNSADIDVDITAYLYSLDPDINNILTDTNELQTDWTDGGRLDVILDSIKAITDILPALSTTVDTPNDANAFTLAAGLDVNDCYIGMTIDVQDANDSHWESRLIIDWEEDLTVEVDEPFGFTPAGGDIVIIWGPAYFPMDVWDSLPIPQPMPVPIVIDNRVGIGTGGTVTLNVEDEDP